ncbi:MAG: hypothetical protein FWF60_02425 [Oscillospiraceae bacterium]|nr:hypothetical protein [Oscillospiraceae bacterium]
MPEQKRTLLERLDGTKFALAHAELWKFVKAACVGICSALPEMLTYLALCALFTRMAVTYLPDFFFFELIIRNLDASQYEPAVQVYAFLISTAVGQVIGFILARRIAFHANSNVALSTFLKIIIVVFTVGVSGVLGPAIVSLVAKIAFLAKYPTLAQIVSKVAFMLSTTLWVYPSDRFIVHRQVKEKKTERPPHPAEKFVKAITYKGVDFEVIERPDVLWVGCVDYADNNTDESDIQGTLKRFQELVKDITPENDTRQLMCPDWSAALSINYCCDDKPCGILFGNETWSARQDERLDVFTQPGGLWLRVRNDKKAARKLLGKRKAEPHEYFSDKRKILSAAAEANGYKQNPDVLVEVEYYCHAEYDKKNHTNYAYIPIIANET